MKFFAIKEEYLPCWTNDPSVTIETIINSKEVSRLAREWDRDEDELIVMQLKEIEIDDMTDAQLAEAIKCNDEWDFDTLSELCRRAGLESEWNEADGDTFESVAYRAAEILGVII